MKKIYVFTHPESDSKNTIGVALCEDGKEIAHHCSSCYEWFRYDMGIKGTSQHSAYKAHCPDGYEVIETSASDPRVLAAQALGRASEIPRDEVPKPEQRCGTCKWYDPQVGQEWIGVCRAPRPYWVCERMLTYEDKGISCECYAPKESPHA